MYFKPMGRAYSILLVTLLTVGSAGAFAASRSTFKSTSQLQGVTLQLNGSGTRVKIAFKTYDLALYTQKSVKTPEALLALPGPKRLSFIALRDMSITDLGVAFLKGIKTNSTQQQTQVHMASITRMIDIFSGQSKLEAGDTFSIDFVPDRGTTFFLKGKAQGAAVGDAEFFNLILNIWMGRSPVDQQLKDALLGQGDKSAP
jgi:hypothetical protein